MRERGLTINLPEDHIEVAVNANHLCDPSVL